MGDAGYIGYSFYLFNLVSVVQILFSLSGRSCGKLGLLDHSPPDRGEIGCITQPREARQGHPSAATCF